MTGSPGDHAPLPSVRAYITNFGGDGISVIDPVRGRLVTHIRTGSKPHGVAIAQLWITTQTTNSVTIIETATQRATGRIEVGKDPDWVGFTPDGSRAVVSNTGSNDVSIVDVAQREVIGTLPVGESPKRLAVGAIVSNRR